MEYGACASWITDADRYTEFEEPIFHEPPVLDNAIIHNSTTIEDMLAIPWITPVWNQCNVTALFPASVHIPTTIAAVREIYNDIVAVVVNESKIVDEDQPEDTSDAVADVQAASSPLNLLESYNVETIPSNKDWVLSVQQSWHPIIINDCFILRFPWHTERDVDVAIQDHYNFTNEEHWIQKKQELIPILLQGGIAFGTGEHATTQLCLQWLHDTVTQTLLLQSESQQETQQSIRVLDYGTGSGILGIAACAIGQKEQHRNVTSTSDYKSASRDDSSPLVTAIGIDIDIDACRIANANAILNGNVSMRSYLPSFHNDNNMHDDESQSLLMKAHYNYQQQQQQRGAKIDQNDVVALDDIVLTDPSTVLSDESFDICVANILAGPLIVLASTLFNYLKPGGKIGMSGILSHQSQMIVETYQNAGFTDVAVHDTMNGWVLVTGQRPFVT
jgi:ribosomal protein L11 methyltransferase